MNTNIYLKKDKKLNQGKITSIIIINKDIYTNK